MFKLNQPTHYKFYFIRTYITAEGKTYKEKVGTMYEWWIYVRALIDITIVAVLLYKIIMFIRDTRAVSILKGLVIVLSFWGISKIFHLLALEYVISQLLLYGVLGFIILFQPELRTALEKLGKNNWTTTRQSNYSEKQKLINDLVESALHMSSTKTGALIVIEMEDSLQEYMNTGVEVDMKVSPLAIETLFFPNCPLHDGAIFIRGSRITHASGYLPLTDRQDLPKELGTRHRASIGLSEVSDALILVVSEETGKISLIRGGTILRPLTKDTLRAELEKHLITKEDNKKFNHKQASKKTLQ